MLSKHVLLWKNLSFILVIRIILLLIDIKIINRYLKCLAQNIIILILTKEQHNFEFELIFNKTSNDDQQTLIAYNKLLLIFEISQVCCSVMVWFFFIAKQAPLVLKKADDRIEEIDSSNEVTDEKTAFNAKPMVTKSKRVFLVIRNITIYISYLFFDPLFLYYLGYVTFAILGMFNPIFVALLLLDVFVR